MSHLSFDLAVSPGGVQFRAARFTNHERRNALTLATVNALHAQLTEQPTDDVILGSSATGIFSAGADLGVSDRERAELSDRLYACYDAMVRRPGIVIAVVEGAAVGAGAQLTTAADLRVASGTARWRWAGPGHGLAVGSWILPDLVGRSRALDLQLSGRWLGAKEALGCGLVARLSPSPWETAVELLDAVHRATPEARARIKAVTTRPALLEALAEERGRNLRGWDGSAPPRP